MSRRAALWSSHSAVTRQALCLLAGGWCSYDGANSIMSCISSCFSSNDCRSSECPGTAVESSGTAAAVGPASASVGNDIATALYMYGMRVSESLGAAAVCIMDSCSLPLLCYLSASMQCC
eukprot:GHRQ01034855.1.p1 GENE.GHRQ01034855.1~~GHRQ01034855.1.p1  ORF type:complete len:120 (+),score=8.31 GHRQ01034855.1:315-674(+)